MELNDMAGGRFGVVEAVQALAVMLAAVDDRLKKIERRLADLQLPVQAPAPVAEADAGKPKRKTTGG